MVERKSMRDAGVPAELNAAIAACHSWLLENAELPRLLGELPSPHREFALEAAQREPARLLELGIVDGEDPLSKAGRVRALLRTLLATQLLDVLPDRLSSAEAAGSPTAFLMDDTRTREALPMLERTFGALDLLWDEAQDRNAALKQCGLESDPNLRTLELLKQSGMALRSLITHVRSLAGANAPRSLAELITFRAAWFDILHGAGCSDEESSLFLGCPLPRDADGRVRTLESLQRSRRRRRALTRDAGPLE